eukprot:713553-Rhodomonas_salina.1
MLLSAVHRVHAGAVPTAPLKPASKRDTGEGAQGWYVTWNKQGDALVVVGQRVRVRDTHRLSCQGNGGAATALCAGREGACDGACREPLGALAACASVPGRWRGADVEQFVAQQDNLHACTCGQTGVASTHGRNMKRLEAEGDGECGAWRSCSKRDTHVPARKEKAKSHDSGVRHPPGVGCNRVAQLHNLGVGWPGPEPFPEENQFICSVQDLRHCAH